MVERLRLDDVNKAANGKNGRNLMSAGLVAPPPRLKAMTPMGVSGISVLSGYVRTTERNAESSSSGYRSTGATRWRANRSGNSRIMISRFSSM